MGWAIACRSRSRSVPVGGEAASGAEVRSGAAGPKVSVAAAAGPAGCQWPQRPSHTPPRSCTWGERSRWGRGFPSFPSPGSSSEGPVGPVRWGRAGSARGPGRAWAASGGGCWPLWACFLPRIAGAMGGLRRP